MAYNRPRDPNLGRCEHKLYHGGTLEAKCRRSLLVRRCGGVMSHAHFSASPSLMRDAFSFSATPSLPSSFSSMAPRIITKSNLLQNF